MSSRRPRRPVIGVSGPDRGGLPAWLFTSGLVCAAGGRPVRVRPRDRAPAPPLDGLVLGGGAHVAPSRYGVDPGAGSASGGRRRRALARAAVPPVLDALLRIAGVPRPGAGDPARDELELALLAEAEERDLAVLGVCRGAQLVNVHAGGTLTRDLTGTRAGAGRWTVLPRWPITVAAASRLEAVLGGRRLAVNKLHDQAVDRPGPGLEVTARDGRGIVQAIERPDRRFWIGVQWHPEFLPQSRSQRRLFRALVAAARAGAGSRHGPPVRRSAVILPWRRSTATG